MSTIISSEGIIHNQSNSTATANAYLRVVSRGKNDVGPFITFTVGSGNPAINITMVIYSAFKQTNADDFDSTRWQRAALYCSTSGTWEVPYNSFWCSGANIGFGFNQTATRVCNLYLVDTYNGAWPGKASMTAEIYCNRWDYLTITYP